jgi:glycosyltransferase involved in cell wall biosynthesis
VVTHPKLLVRRGAAPARPALEIVVPQIPMPLTALAISVVVPAWNESLRIGATLDRLLADAPGLGIAEVIVVNDGSSDDTASIVRGKMAAATHTSVRLRLIDHPRNRGKGAALRTGLAATSSPLVGYLDADLSIGPAPLLEARRIIDAGADVVIGHRLPGNCLDERPDQPPLRRVLSFLFKQVQRAMIGLPVRDTQSPFKLFRREALEAALPGCKAEGWAFDVEVLLLAARRGYRLVDQPVPWKFIGGSTVRATPRTSMRVMRELLTIRRTHGSA